MRGLGLGALAVLCFSPTGLSRVFSFYAASLFFHGFALGCSSSVEIGLQGRVGVLWGLALQGVVGFLAWVGASLQVGYLEYLYEGSSPDPERFALGVLLALVPAWTQGCAAAYHLAERPRKALEEVLIGSAVVMGLATLILVFAGHHSVSRWGPIFIVGVGSLAFLVGALGGGILRWVYGLLDALEAAFFRPEGAPSVPSPDDPAEP